MRRCVHSEYGRSCEAALRVSAVELVMRDVKLWPRVSGRVVGRDGQGVSGAIISPQTTPSG